MKNGFSKGQLLGALATIQEVLELHHPEWSVEIKADSITVNVAEFEGYCGPCGVQDATEKLLD